MASNVKRLEAEGLVFDKALPVAHKDVLDKLTADELDVILDVAARLALADKKEGLVERAFTCFMTF
jgi:hypothetical protein